MHMYLCFFESEFYAFHPAGMKHQEVYALSQLKKSEDNRTRIDDSIRVLGITHTI